MAGLCHQDPHGCGSEALRPLPGSTGTGFPSLAGHHLLVPNLVPWKPHLRRTPVHPPPLAIAPSAVSTSAPLKDPLDGSGERTERLEPVWLPGMDLSWPLSQVPVLASLGWDGVSRAGRRRGAPGKGWVERSLSGKFISHHILQLFTSLTEFGHPDMKRGSPLTNIIEEGPK